LASTKACNNSGIAFLESIIPTKPK
jgi:hypothetical protein